MAELVHHTLDLLHKHLHTETESPTDSLQRIAPQFAKHNPSLLHADQLVSSHQLDLVAGVISLYLLDHHPFPHLAMLLHRITTDLKTLVPSHLRLVLVDMLLLLLAVDSWEEVDEDPLVLNGKPDRIGELHLQTVQR